MKIYSAEGLAALDSGQSLDIGAIRIGSTPPLCVWGGYGVITIDGDEFHGLADRVLVTVTGGSLGVGAEPSEIKLSRSDPAVEAMLAAPDLWRAPVTIWRLLFDAGGRNLLDAKVHQRGRIDDAEDVDVPGGDTNLVLKVEGAARGLGRSLGRMRSDPDHRLVNALSGAMKHIGAFASKQLFWGGRRPVRAGGALGRIFGNSWNRLTGGSST